MKQLLRWLRSDPAFAFISLSIIAALVGFWVAVMMLVAKGLGL